MYVCMDVMCVSFLPAAGQTKRKLYTCSLGNIKKLFEIGRFIKNSQLQCFGSISVWFQTLWFPGSNPQHFGYKDPDPQHFGFKDPDPQKFADPIKTVRKTFCSQDYYKCPNLWISAHQVFASN